ncbi:MAG: ribosome biosis GTPase / thiamine phosphate phosphatase [Gaiellaceae bacterium]|jgi:ribosome biogenesis GTPase|nr:ribosome biosis GTPase / thiamine phosphate phosphatase [Gaiellaceae bacterium]
MLEAYGWSDELQKEFEPLAERGLVPARVSVQQRGILTLVTAEGELPATLSGKFFREAAQGDHPVAGDWVGVAVQPDGSGVIQALVPRRAAFVRRAAGTGATDQVVAANADTALLVAALTRDLNLRRLERYLALAWTSGSDPVVVLTKADLAEDLDAQVAEVRAITPGVPVLVVSAVDGRGLDDLRAVLSPGKTAVLLGSSGAGKSTLVNVLAGTERMATQETRPHDERGRHTTTHRELILLPSGAILLDTPGMRELGVVESLDGLTDAFADIDELARQCKFNDCAHETEPGCAIRAALADGTLSQERYDSYVKLERERAYLERRDDPAALAAEKKKWKAQGKEGEEALRLKGRD